AACGVEMDTEAEANLVPNQPRPTAPVCPRCQNSIELVWLFCPHCEERLKDERHGPMREFAIEPSPLNNSFRRFLAIVGVLPVLGMTWLMSQALIRGNSRDLYSLLIVFCAVAIAGVVGAILHYQRDATPISLALVVLETLTVWGF